MTQYAAFAPSLVSTQIFLDSAQELLGKVTLQGLVGRFAPDGQPVNASGADKLVVEAQAAFQPEQFVQILEEIYGIPGGRGLALRMGRAAFRYGLKQLGEEAGLNAVTYRLLPVPRKQAVGLKILAQQVEKLLGDRITLTDEGDAWIWRSENCPFCQSRKSDDPCCAMTVGFLQEFMSWAGGGRYYRVVETECHAANGTACTFRIEKKPVD